MMQQHSFSRHRAEDIGIGGVQDIMVRQHNVQNQQQPQSTMVVASSSVATEPDYETTIYQLSLVGWQRVGFYLLLIVTVCLVLLNSVLTIWIMTVINFSSDGMGKLRAGPEGVSLAGDAFMLRDVYANNIQAPTGQQLRVLASNEIRIHNRSARLALGLQSVQARIAGQMVMRNPDGRLMLVVDDDNVVLTASRLQVNNPSGIAFNCSLQAPRMQSSSSHPELKLSSLTRRARLLGPRRVSLRAGRHMRLQSLRQLQFRSTSKTVTLNSTRIELRNLRVAMPTKRGRTYPGIAQLCICPQNGRLYTTAADAECIYDESICSAAARQFGHMASSKRKRHWLHN